MDSHTIRIPTYDEVVPNRMYSRDSLICRPTGISDLSKDILALARIRVVSPHDTCSVITKVAAGLMGPEDGLRLPSPLELALCGLPEQTVQLLAQGVEMTEKLLKHHINATEASRLPGGSPMLQLTYGLVPANVLEVIQRECPIDELESTIFDLLIQSGRTNADFGHRWTGLSDSESTSTWPIGTWPIVGGYEGQADALRPLGDILRIEANQYIKMVREAVGTAEQLKLIPDRSEYYKDAYILRMVEQLVQLNKGD